MAFQVLATDGLWEVMSNAEVVGFVEGYRRASHEAMSSADALSWEAQQRWKAGGSRVRRRLSNLLIKSHTNAAGFNTVPNGPWPAVCDDPEITMLRQVTADDVAVVVLHLIAPPPPAHPGRPAGIPPAAATSAAANDPSYLSACRAAAAARAPRPSTAESVPAPAASIQRLQQGRSGVVPVAALQDPARASASRPLKVVTARRSSGGDAESSALPPPSAAGPTAVTDFRTDSAYTHDLRCDPAGVAEKLRRH